MLDWICILFLGTLGWGCSLYLIKILLTTLTPSEIVLYRMAIGAVTLFFLSGFLNIERKFCKYLLMDGLIMGIFNMVLPFYLTTLAEENTTSFLAAVLNALTPMFTFLLMIPISSKQKINVFNISSILLGLIGVLSINLDFTIGKPSVLDILALIATSVSYAIAANYINFYAKTKQPILIAAMAACVSTLMMFFWQLGQAKLWYWNFPHHFNQILALIWLGTIGSGLCLYLYFLLIRRTGPMTATMITYLMTATGVLMGTVFLNERMSSMSFLGCLFIIFSLIFSNHAGQFQTYLRNFNSK